MSSIGVYSLEATNYKIVLMASKNQPIKFSAQCLQKN